MFSVVRITPVPTVELTNALYALHVAEAMLVEARRKLRLDHGILVERLLVDDR